MGGVQKAGPDRCWRRRSDHRPASVSRPPLTCLTSGIVRFTLCSREPGNGDEREPNAPKVAKPYAEFAEMPALRSILETCERRRCICRFLQSMRSGALRSGHSAVSAQAYPPDRLRWAIPVAATTPAALDGKVFFQPPHGVASFHKLPGTTEGYYAALTYGFTSGNPRVFAR